MTKAFRLLSPPALWIVLLLAAGSAPILWWWLKVRSTHGWGQKTSSPASEWEFALASFALDRKPLVASGLPRDGIAPLTYPGMLQHPELSALGKRFLLPQDPVLGVVLHGQARAYPLRVMAFHELANDLLGEEPILVVHQPLCGLSAVFSRRLAGQPRTFGHSGLLWNSCGLLYDRETQELWLPINGQGLTGSARGLFLKILPFALTTWQRWVDRYPQTTLLRPDLSRLPQYRRDPYSSYAGSELLRFPVSPRLPQSVPTKAPLWVFWPGTAKHAVVGIVGFPPQQGASVTFSLGQRRLSLSGVGRPLVWELSAADGAPLPPTIHVYAFAWYALNPIEPPENWSWLKAETFVGPDTRRQPSAHQLP
ncbi:MAG: DUF3179 domain-containing protein [Thermoanaerobaculum sp.]|nr:DUF3179 domain-containing protein [Thermoanaerobaculum sp.]MDW7968482.1 DUF3179 domain-containing (seleno)protein [Thermoanaerobaculum sp.]